MSLQKDHQQFLSFYKEKPYELFRFIKPVLKQCNILNEADNG